MKETDYRIAHVLPDREHWPSVLEHHGRSVEYMNNPDDPGDYYLVVVQNPSGMK